MSFDLGDYKDVAERLADFRAKHPDGSLQPANLSEPFRVVTIGDRAFIAYTAAAYRSPDDPRPGIGTAYEPFPGKTPYTRDSELQNAETSAWGRAILAALASESRSVASADEVRNRRADQGQPPQGGGKACAQCGEPLAGRAIPTPNGPIHEACAGEAA
jgi:hypothetical protein